MFDITIISVQKYKKKQYNNNYAIKKCRDAPKGASLQKSHYYDVGRLPYNDLLCLLLLANKLEDVKAALGRSLNRRDIADLV